MPKVITIKSPHGKEYTIKEISKKYGVNEKTIRARYNRGCTWKELIEPYKPPTFLIKDPDGKEWTMDEIAKKYGLVARTVRRRIKDGWKWDQIISPANEVRSEAAKKRYKPFADLEDSSYMTPEEHWQAELLARVEMVKDGRI